MSNKESYNYSKKLNWTKLVTQGHVFLEYHEMAAILKTSAFDCKYWVYHPFHFVNVILLHPVYFLYYCTFCYSHFRYNPEHLSTLEKYVEVQCAENVYDLEANLAVLKLYQFHQNYNMKITSQILLKALTNFPHTDFILCKCLLSKDLVSNSHNNASLILVNSHSECGCK